VQDTTGPTPGTVRRRSSRARQMGLDRTSSARSLSSFLIFELSQRMCSLICPWTRWGAVRRRLRSEVTISTNWRRRSTRPRSSRDFASGSGRLGGLTPCAKRASTRASIESVLASLPIARAKSRTCQGFTIDTGRPPSSSSAATDTSSAPVASKTTPQGCRAMTHSTSRPMPWPSLLNRWTCPPGSTAVSKYAAETSIPMKASARCDVEMVTRTSFSSCAPTQAQPCKFGLTHSGSSQLFGLCGAGA